MEDYDIVANIGKGSSGSVFLARSNASKKLVAIKRIEIDENKRSRSKKSVVREASILLKLLHPCIVECDTWFLDKEEKVINIVLEYCDGGTMQEMVRKGRNQNKFFPEEKILKWLAEITSAVAYMHEKKILHRDLKTENVFIVKPDNAKLGDFGISKQMDHTLDLAQTCVGTPCYLSPELCRDVPYNAKSDVWALGCLLFEMTALKPAFDAANLVSLFYKIVKGNFAELPDHCSETLRDLVSTILQHDPDLRPTADELLKEHALVEYAEAIKIKRAQYERAPKTQRSPRRAGASKRPPSVQRSKTLGDIPRCENRDTIIDDTPDCAVSPGPVQAYSMFISGAKSKSTSDSKALCGKPRLPPIAGTNRSVSVLETSACRNAVKSEVPKLFVDEGDGAMSDECDEVTEIETARPQTCPHSATRRDAAGRAADSTFTDTVVTWSGYGDRGSRRPSGKQRRRDSISLSSGTDDSDENEPIPSKARSELPISINMASDGGEEYRYSDSSLCSDDDSDILEEFIRDEQGDDEIPEVIDDCADGENTARRGAGDGRGLPGSAWLGPKRIQGMERGTNDHKGTYDGGRGQKGSRRKKKLPGSSWLSRKKVAGTPSESSSDDAIILGEVQDDLGMTKHTKAAKQRSKRKSGKIDNLPGSAWLRNSMPASKGIATVDDTITTGKSSQGKKETDRKEGPMAMQSCSSGANEYSSPEKKSYSDGYGENDYSYSDDFDDYEDDFELSDGDGPENMGTLPQQKSSLDMVRQGCIEMLGENVFEDLLVYFKRGLTLSQVVNKFKGKKLDNETVETCYMLLYDE